MISSVRIGHGFDAHAFCDGDSIILGGVAIPYHKSFKAHSDGDVLIHALCDAMLGAVGEGDIGQHFPDTDPKYADMDSRYFLRSVLKRVNDKGYGLLNADITIIAQSPKMQPHYENMKGNLCSDLECDSAVINIKATTTERMGFTGREEGVAVNAVVLVEKTA